MLKVKKFQQAEAEDESETLLDKEEDTGVVSPKQIQELIKSNRRLARFSFYSIFFTLFVALFFSWIAGYYAIALDTKISEQKVEFIRELDNRFSSTGLFARQERQIVGPLEVSETAPTLGSADAKVTIVEFADFQCPFCGIYYNDVEKKLIEKYVDTGLAKYVFMDFAFLGEESMTSANAAKCSGEQGKFWQYHNELFLSQKGENGGNFDSKTLLALAKRLGLDVSRFSACVEEERYAGEVESNTLAGRRAGVTGTPTVFINGQMIVGAQDYTVFASAVEDALSLVGE